MLCFRVVKREKSSYYHTIPVKAIQIGARELSEPQTVFLTHVSGITVIGHLSPKGMTDAQTENYRAITVLTCIAEIFEQLIGEQMTVGFHS